MTAVTANGEKRVFLRLFLFFLTVVSSFYPVFICISWKVLHLCSRIDKVKRQIYGCERSVLRICLCISCMHRVWTRESCVAHRVSVLNIALPVEFYCYVDEINWWCMAAYISAQTIPATGNGVPATGNGVPACGNDGNELWVSTLFKIRQRRWWWNKL